MKSISRNPVRKLIAMALLIILLAFLRSAFKLSNIFDSSLYDPATVYEFSYRGNYKIDSSTILKSIDSDQSTVFFPETLVISTSNAKNELSWTQLEYYKITVALFEFVWKESLNKNWSIHRLFFETVCKENPAGFEHATFLFNQLIFQNEHFRYNARAIEITPLDNEVLWGGGNTYLRPVFGESQIDLDNLTILADDALNIAEKNGGKDLRVSVKNSCDLTVSLEDGIWKVIYYYSDPGSASFRIDIDPYTGKVINTKPQDSE